MNRLFTIILLIILFLNMVVPLTISLGVVETITVTNDMFGFDGINLIRGDFESSDDLDFWVIDGAGNKGLSQDKYHGNWTMVVSGITGVTYIYTQLDASVLDIVRGKYIGVVAAVKLVEGNDVNATGYIMYSTPSGGCPWLYVWNGKEYIADNNLIPFRVSNDTYDYYILQVKPSISDEDKINLMIKEEETEEDYIDMVKLKAIIHPNDTEIALDQYNNVRTYKPQELILPRTVILSRLPSSINFNPVDKVSRKDFLNIELLPGDYMIVYSGDREDLGLHESVKLVFRADQDEKLSLKVQILTNEGWTDVAEIHPRIKWYTHIVDLSNCLPDVEGEYKVRIISTERHKIDFIALDFSEDKRITEISLSLIEAYHVTSNDSIVNVLHYLVSDDEHKVKIIPGEAIELTFRALSRKIVGDLEVKGQRVSYMIIINGYWKRLGDPIYTSELVVETELVKGNWSFIYTYTYIDSTADNVWVGIKIDASRSSEPVTVLIDYVHMGYSAGYDSDKTDQYWMFIANIATFLTKIIYDSSTSTIRLEFMTNVVGLTDKAIRRADHDLLLLNISSNIDYLMKYDTFLQWNDKGDSGNAPTYVGEEEKYSIISNLLLASDIMDLISDVLDFIPEPLPPGKIGLAIKIARVVTTYGSYALEISAWAINATWPIPKDLTDDTRNVNDDKDAHIYGYVEFSEEPEYVMLYSALVVEFYGAAPLSLDGAVIDSEGLVADSTDLNTAGYIAEGYNFIVFDTS